MKTYKDLTKEFINVSRNVWLLGLGTIVTLTQETQNLVTKSSKIKVLDFFQQKHVMQMIYEPVDRIRESSVILIKNISQKMETIQFPGLLQIRQLSMRLTSA